jgi:hypothetical protein
LLAYMNRAQGYRREDIQRVSVAISGASREIGVSENDLRIYGDYGLWFAHPHSFRAASPSTLRYADEANLFVCYEQFSANKGMVAGNMLYCLDLRQQFPLVLISTTLVRGNTLHLYARKQGYERRHDELQGGG